MNEQILSFLPDLDQKWQRPKLSQQPDPAKDPIVFQHIDIDHYNGLERDGSGNPILDSNKGPVIRMFGVTREGHSILCNVHGFYPYFYVLAAKKPDTSELDQFKDTLNKWCALTSVRRKTLLPDQVLRVEHVVAKNIYGYCGEDKQNFLKIVVTLPQNIRAVTKTLQNDSIMPLDFYYPAVDDRGHSLFEADIDYDIRFMVDNKISGFSWIELPPGRYALRENFQSHCQIECDVNYTDLIVHPPEGEWADIAPLRTLSFDIEATFTGFSFPVADKNNVIQISSVLVTHGVKEPISKCIFTLRSCAPIEGATVMSFSTEIEMLLTWSKFLITVDPDIITGYNIKQFDLKFLLERAKKLKIDAFPHLGRIIQAKTHLIKTPTRSKNSLSPTISIGGRIIFDLLLVLRKDFKLQSYSLDSVSEHFLHDKKDDVHYSMIPKLFNGNEFTRRKLAVYCIKDSVLPVKILDKLMCVINYIELARVTGVTLNHLLNRGQHIKLLSLILREARKHNYLLPTLLANSDDDLNGPAGLESMLGYHDNPMASFEQSISIIMKYNLCYTTLLSRKDAEKYDIWDDDYVKTPAGFLFMKPNEEHKTVVPQILKNLQDAYHWASEDLVFEEDPLKRTIITRRQLASIVSANALYRFTSNFSRRLPCPGITLSIREFAKDETCRPLKRRLDDDNQKEAKRTCPDNNNNNNRGLM